MKNITFTFFCLFLINSIATSQTNFNIGFKDGFKNGYCYSNNQSGYYCNPPLPPLSPLPQISENRNSYQDGYNRGFLYGQARRNKDDDNSSNRNVSPNPPKFNPYVPQNPITTFTPDERDAYYSAKARKDQADAEAIGFLLETIFTSTPEGRARRAQQHEKYVINEAQRKLEKENRKGK